MNLNLLETERILQRIPLWNVYKVLDAACLTEIHVRGLEIAETLGLAMSIPEARQRLTQRGLRVVDERVFIPPQAIREYLECRRQWLAPEVVSYQETNLPLGVESAVAAQYDLDLDTDEIVPVTTDRLIQQVKLVHAARKAGIRVKGIPMNIPADVSPAMVPIIEFLVSQEYSDHPPFYCWNWPERTRQYLLEMHRVIRDAESSSAATWVLSPLRLAGNCFELLWARIDECSRFSVYSHGIMGASLPVQPLAAAAVSVAEVLAAATALWLLSGGKPVDFTIGMVPFDIRHLTQLYHGPEQSLLEMLCEQLNLFYGNPPARSANIVTLACRPGFQAGVEKMAGAVWGVARGATWLSAAGALSREEVYSMEQFILDWELCCFAERLRQGIAAENSAHWLEIAREGLEHGYVNTDTTLDHYREVYWQPELFNRYTLMAWRKRGERDLRETARAKVRALLSHYDYQPPADVVCDLRKIAEKARQELG